MSERARGWIETVWPILVAVALVALSYGLLQGRVTAAQSTADEARADAKAAREATQGVREALIDLKRTVEERLPPRPR